MILYVDSNYLSPYAMSAFVALREKGLTFEIVTLDLARGDHKATDFAAVSLTQRVPTLVDDGFSLSESSAIAEYLEDTQNGVALYPPDPKHRARARQLQAWLRSDLMALRQERPTDVVFCAEQRASLTEAARIAAQRLCAVASQLLKHGGPNVFEQWSIVDVDLALMLNRLRLHGDVIPERLAAYAAKQWEQPSVVAWLKLPRPAGERLKGP